MLSLHNLGHIFAIVTIAVLIHIILDLNTQMKNLQQVYSDPRQSNIVRDDITKSKSQSTQKSNSEDSENMNSINLNPSKSFDASYNQHSTFQSSVWCRHGDKHFCKISNLCYHGNTEEFFVFKDEYGVYNHIDFTDGTFTLDLSSISDHNVYQTEILSIPSTYSDKVDIHWVNGTTLIFQPFLPGNIMHVFHDDLIPLYHSVKFISPQYISRNECKKVLSANRHLEPSCTQSHSSSFSKSDSIQIFSLEDLQDTEFEDLYKLFSAKNIVYKEDFDNKGLTCFREAYVGLLTDTVWYNFGFTKPQCPIDRVTVTGNQIRQTAQYIRDQLKVDVDPVSLSDGEYIVLLTRKENRRILNEGDLTLELIKQLRIKVINLNLETYSMKGMIEIVANSKGIIGMHGSLLILSIFLKPGSIVIELFPYAINSSNYTPYKTLANLDGMDIIYASWANENPLSTVGHPDWPEEVGGLGHLDPVQREIIINQTDVPPHLCCSDPSWLYHIYQDTEVDTKTVTPLVQNALEKSRKIQLSSEKSTFYTSKVQNINCFITTKGKLKNIQNNKYFLHLKWEVPWTSSLLSEHDKLHYEVLIQDFDSESISASVSSHKSSVTEMSVNVEGPGSYNVWIKCVVNDTYSGPFSHAVSCENKDQ